MLLKSSLEYFLSEFDSIKNIDIIIKDDKKFDKIVFDFFEKLNLSIICCDYLSDINETKSLVIELKSKIKKIPIPTPEDENDESGQERSNKFIAFRQLVLIAIEKLEYTLSFIEKKYTFSDIGNVFEIGDDYSSNPFIIDLADSLQRNFNLFQINLNIFLFDFGLSYNTDKINTLTSYQREIQKEYSDLPLQRQISIKAKFLVHKILIRTLQTKDVDKLIIVEGINELLFDLKKKPDNTRFEEYSEYIKNHYELKNSWKHDLEKFIAIKKLTEKSLEELTFFEIHRLVKYYKDIKPNLEKLSEIRNQLQPQFSVYEKEEICFDKYALAISLNYVANNHFSLFLQNLETIYSDEGIDDISIKIFSQIDLAYKEITEIQQETNVKNFFPQFRLIKFLSRIFKSLKSKELIFKKKEVTNKIISYLDDVRDLKKNYENNITWMNNNYNLVFQLPFEECKLKKPDSDKYIFVASSFVLPLDRLKYFEEFKEYELEIKSLKSSLDIFNIVDSEIGNTKSEFEKKIGKEIKENEIRNIELLGIFSAFLALISAAINSLGYIDTAVEGLIFTLALITSIPLFVLIILSITRDKYLKSNWFLIVLIIVFFIISWSSVICLDNGKLKVEKLIDELSN